MKKKLKYIPKFQKQISFTELIMNFKKSCFFHKRNASSLKEQSQPLNGVASAVQKRSMYLDRSFRYW